MEQYKRAIEAIVGPLPGSGRTKNNLRRELWAHFCSLVDEERSWGRDEPAATDNAWRRLGSQADIERAFMQDVPRSERKMCAFDQWLRLSAEKSGGWLILFLAVAAGLGVAACFILGLSFPAWLEGRSGGSTFVFYVVMAVSVAGWYGCWTLYAFRRLSGLERLATASALQGRLTKPLVGALARSAVAGCLYAVGCGLLGYLLVASHLGWRHSDTLAFIHITPWLLLFEWAACSLTLLYAIPREAFYSQPIPDWPYTGR